MIRLKHTTWVISAVMLLGLSACSDGDEKPKAEKERNETTTVSQEPVVEEVEEVVEEEEVVIHRN